MVRINPSHQVSTVAVSKKSSYKAKRHKIQQRRKERLKNKQATNILLHTHTHTHFGFSIENADSL